MKFTPPKLIVVISNRYAFDTKPHIKIPRDISLTVDFGRFGTHKITSLKFQNYIRVIETNDDCKNKNTDRNLSR